MQCIIALKSCRYHLIQVALDPTCSAQPLIACQIPASCGSSDCLFVVKKRVPACAVSKTMNEHFLLFRASKTIFNC